MLGALPNPLVWNRDEDKRAVTGTPRRRKTQVLVISSIKTNTYTCQNCMALSPWLHSLHKYFSAVVFPLRISILKKYIGQSEFCCNSTELVELPCSGRSSLSLRTEVFQYSELVFPQVDIVHCEKPLVYCLWFQGHYHIKTNGNHTLVWKVSLSAIWDYLLLQAKSKTNHLGVLCSLCFGKHFPQSLSLSSIREAWQQWQKKTTPKLPYGEGSPCCALAGREPGTAFSSVFIWTGNSSDRGTPPGEVFHQLNTNMGSSRVGL